METHYVNLLILIARLTQVACGLLIFGFSIAATVRNEEYWYGYDHDLPFASIFCGAAIAIFGACGLFGVRRRGDEPDQFRLSTLLLFIDCWALILCLAVGTMLSIQGHNWDEEYIGPSAILYTPAVFAYLCGAVILLPLMIRTIRLWWKVLLYGLKDKTHIDKAMALETQHSHTCCHQHHYHDPELNYTAAPAARKSYQTEAMKSQWSSRPHSVISAADSLSYPNIDNVAQSGAPTRVPSHAAPSYTPRVEVGSKIQHS